MRGRMMAKSKKIKYPTMEEVRQYLDENNLNVDIGYFEDLAACDWINGNGEEVKNWKMTARTFHRYGWRPRPRPQGVASWLKVRQG